MIEIINGSKFVSLSEKVFSAIVSPEDFEKFNQFGTLKIIQTYHNDKMDAIWFYNENLKVGDGDIVFCQTEALELLFKKLSNANVKNLILISHQSDRKIDKKLWNKKPKNIYKWFGTNVVFESNDLIGIPIGICNDYTINYNFKNFIGKNSTKEELLFVNFRINTNFKERKFAFKYLSKVSKPKMNIPQDNYFKSISKSKFVSAPWGNGYDTHRLWESLYLGSIPITRNNLSYQNFSDLPILFVNNWKNINKDYLLEKYQNLAFYPEKIEKIKFSYWRKLILNVKMNSNENNVEYELDADISKQLKKFKKKSKYNSNIKKLTRLKYKYLTLENYINYLKKLN